MPEELIISISGLRGLVGQNLTADIAADYGRSYGSFLRKESREKNTPLKVCIGRDSRPSGQMLQSAVAGGLCDVGIDVIDLGMVTTASVGVMLREIQCDGGVVITASHNPEKYNGIKLLMSNGVAPPPQKAERIKQIYFDKDFNTVEPSEHGKVTKNRNTYDTHISKVLKIVNEDAISAKKYKVVLDSVNGAGGPITKKLLARLGCQTIAINDDPTGVFDHTPEPIAENLTILCEVVKAKGAHIGFAQDPDADRLAVVDENGKYIGEEYTLALAAKYIFTSKKGSAATNLSTSRMIDDIANETGCEVIRTPVGEANVAEAMLENNCVIGGEGNGGVIDLRVGPIRDSLVGIALILQLMTETGKSVGQLAGGIGGYYMSKDKFEADKGQARQIMDLAKERFSHAKLNTADGCRFDFDNGWLHLRMSNTEPVMRIIVEADDRQTAQNYIDAVMNIRKSVLG